jgi:hypothetical protein
VKSVAKPAGYVKPLTAYSVVFFMLENRPIFDGDLLSLEFLLSIHLHPGNNVTACKDVVRIENDAAPGCDIALLVLSGNVHYSGGNLTMNKPYP